MTAAAPTLLARFRRDLPGFSLDVDLTLPGRGVTAIFGHSGSGKTSLIIQTIRRLKERLRIAVIEGDIESMVDSEKILAEGIPAVQIRTGGAC